MTRSESIAKIAGALAKAQRAIKGAIKDSKNPHFGSDYADLESVAEACREPLASNEIAVVQSPSTQGNIAGMVTLFLHVSGEYLESDVLNVQARDAGPQAIGSCLTYLRRYQLAAMAGVAPTEDDAEAGEGRARQTNQKQVKAPVAETKVAAISPSASSKPSSPNGGDSGALAPKGAVLISDFQPTPTQNPSVTKYILTVAGGPDWPANQTTVSTVNSWLASMAETHHKNKMPVFITTKKTTHGYDLVSIAPAEATA